MEVLSRTAAAQTESLLPPEDSAPGFLRDADVLHCFCIPVSALYPQQASCQMHDEFETARQRRRNARDYNALPQQIVRSRRAGELEWGVG
jgi:hypothetical protein